MSKKKITYRSPVIWNVVLFILFSFLFLFLQDSFYLGISDLDADRFGRFVESHKVQGFIYLATCFVVYRMSRFVSLFFWLSSLMTISFSVYGLWMEFSKFIIVLLFVYVMFSYYLYQFLREDLKESYYNPLFEDQYLFEPMCMKIPVKFQKKGEPEVTGHLTNWSEGGFFAYLPNKDRLGGKYEIVINYKGHDFRSHAVVVSRLKTQQGYGFKVLVKKNESSLNWKKFLDIIYEMGYQPELLV